MAGRAIICTLAFVVVAHALVAPGMLNKGKVDRHSKEEESDAHWQAITAKELEKKVRGKLNDNIARNVIFFLGDGMSVATVTAARIYAGQLRDESGEENSLTFEQFPFSGFSKTYCVDSQVADSACSATAFLTGVKAQKGTLGVNGKVALGDCRRSLDQKTHTKSIIEWAQEAGKGTGIISTSRMTDATPAAAYSHVANRTWESDTNVMESGEDPTKCKDIASQMVENIPGKNVNVLLGGGRGAFYSPDQETIHGSGGERSDGRDLIREWVKEKPDGKVAGYVPDRSSLRRVDFEKTDHLLGLFSDGFMSFNLTADRSQEPSLPEMVEAAIRVLEKYDKGYVLFVEGGRIDHGHHDNMAKAALDETVMFSEAVKTALQMTYPSETLIVVTADHAHVMTISGYPGRGTDILGVGGTSDIDKLPYSTLTYANGPSAIDRGNGPRSNVLDEDTHGDDYKFPSLVPLSMETHGGEDVGVYATGPWSHLFTGVFEQSYIPGAIMYASCLGPGPTVCSNKG